MHDLLYTPTFLEVLSYTQVKYGCSSFQIDSHLQATSGGHAVA
jgi:hypothetical protein